MNRDSKVFVLFLSGCAFFLGLLVCISYYNWPNAEDLSLTLIPRNIGLINSIKHMMGTYDGRYFTNLLHGINPLAWGFVEFVWLITPVSIVFVIFGLYYFFSALFEAKRFYIFGLSIFITSIHFATCLSISHQLFWMSSSFVYLYSVVFLLLFLGTYIRYLESLHLAPNQRLLLFSLIFLFCGVGMNEMMLPAYSIFLAHQIYYHFKSTFFKELLPIYFVGFCSIVFFVASPGIQMRLSNDYYFDNPFGFYSIKIAVIQYFQYIYLTLKMPLTWAAFLFMFFLKSNFLPKSNFSFNGYQSVLFLLFVFPFMLILPYYVPLSHFNCFPDRIYGTINLVHFVAICLVINNSKFSFLPQIQSNLFLLPILMFGLALFSKSNVKDLFLLYHSGKLECFKTQFVKRDRILKEASSSEFTFSLVELDTLKCVPDQIWIYTDMKPGTKANHWNKAYQNYYSVDKVLLKDSKRRTIDAE